MYIEDKIKIRKEKSKYLSFCKYNDLSCLIDRTKKTLCKTNKAPVKINKTRS